jgi:curved DNA-binding protein CbpA
MVMNLNYALNLFGLRTLENVDETSLKLTYIKLAKTKHPDKSGSHEEFVALKEAHELLLDILKQKKSNLPAFLASQSSTLSQTNYGVLKEQYEILEDTRESVNTLIYKMQSRKKQIELIAIEELRGLEKEIDNNVWFKMSKTFLNKYPQAYYDKKTSLRIKAQNLKSSVDKQIFKEIISEYSKSLDLLAYNLTLIDKDEKDPLDNTEVNE